MTDRTCSVDGCERKSHLDGWCLTHFNAWRRYGDPLKSLPMKARSIAPRGQRRLSPDGYVQVHRVNHPVLPSSSKGNPVLEHRMVMYDLGLLTDPSHVVHHIDRDKLNNDPSNLRVMTASEHARLHRAEDAESAGDR